MLYLAEVQKRSGGVFGGGKAEFKLIACQRSEQNWSAVQGDESVPAPDDATYSPGALAMVELTGNRQIQRHYEAGRSLVSILQNFSSLSKKFKTQEDEIEQWKQSLTYQSQELNRREMEIEARQEELEQAEADLEKVEAQKEEVEKSREALTALRQDYERKQSELEGAWAHLNGEMRRLEERQAELQTRTGLDSAQTQQIQDALNRLTGTVQPTETLRNQLNDLQAIVAEQQSKLEAAWQDLGNYRSSLGEQEAAIATQAQTLDQQWQQRHGLEEKLIDLKTALKQNQALLDVRLDQSQALSQQLQQQSSLYQQIYELLNTGDRVRLSKKVDVAALEAMPLGELEVMVTELGKDLDKMSRFVSDQEEELKFQQQAIDEVKAKIDAANDFDRLQLETELADEQDRYRMLNETLVGQRRNLVEREEVLSQHRAVLLRRQGLSADEKSLDAAGLEPILEQIDQVRQQLTARMQPINDEIGQLQSTVDELKQGQEQKGQELATLKIAIQETEKALVALRDEVSQKQGKVSLYESFLQPIQDRVDQARQQLESVMAMVNQHQEASDYQLQAISELQQTVQNLVAEPVGV